jgi:hypothetical protein
MDPASFSPGNIKHRSCDHIIKFVTKKRKNPEVCQPHMSLENIQLHPVTLQQLYKYSLIGPRADNEVVNEGNKALQFLGGNRKGIFVLVDNNEATFLPGSQLDLLMEILSACKLTMEDVALVNINKADFNYRKLPDLEMKIVLVFGIAFSDLGLPFKIPEFQVQSFEEHSWLLIPSINLLQENKELKRKLWLCLKQLFSL